MVPDQADNFRSILMSFQLVLRIIFTGVGRWLRMTQNGCFLFFFTCGLGTKGLINDKMTRQKTPKIVLLS